MVSECISVFDIPIEIQRKKMKNIRFRVLPPDGRVRVSAPKNIAKRELHELILERMDWIKKQRDYFQSLPEIEVPQFKTGDSLLYLGEAYTLVVHQTESRSRAQIDHANKNIVLWTSVSSNSVERELVVEKAYKQQMQELVPKLLDKWQVVVGQEVASWTIRKMKSRWGSCNIQKRKICLNLELMKHRQGCMEYVLVHELVHLYERYHNKVFYSYMDKFLPNWREFKNELNKPL